MISLGVKDRSFVLAIDNPGRGYRIESTTKCESEVKTGYESKEFDTSTWEYLTEWVIGWFECERAPASVAGDPDAVEVLLERYQQAAVTDDYEEIIRANLPREIVPAKSWLKLTFQRKT
jgi:hypothetical protein